MLDATLATTLARFSPTLRRQSSASSAAQSSALQPAARQSSLLAAHGEGRETEVSESFSESARMNELKQKMASLKL